MNKIEYTHVDVRKDTELCISTKSGHFSTKRAAKLSVLPPDYHLFLTFYLLYQGLVIVEAATFLVSDFHLLVRFPGMKTYFVNSSIK